MYGGGGGGGQDHYINWGEPERAPPSLYNEEISVCLSSYVQPSKKFARVGRENLGGPGHTHAH